MDRMELREKLLDEFDMQAAYIDAALNQIEEFEDGLKETFFTFLQSQKVPDIEVEKYSCKSLIEVHKFTVIGAFLMLDWMMKDMDAAEALLMFM